MPAVTRTRTGAAKRTDYSYATLKLQGEAVADLTSSNKPETRRGRRVAEAGQPLMPTKFPRKGNRKSKVPPLDFNPESVAKEWKEDLAAIKISEIDLCEGANFIPDVCFGQREEKGMSNIQRLDAEIEKWEKVKKAHQEHLPRVVPIINETLRELKEKRDKMEENEENTRIVNEHKIKEMIEDRIIVLRKTLNESDFEPEKENIRAAIRAYEYGEIAYSEQYTLIWNGRVVDKANTYADFTCNRRERLDRYAKEYGPHWLWWEKGLRFHPSSMPRASKCLELIRAINPNGLGQYYIKQLFWKRAGWVHRMPTLIGNNPEPVPPEDSQGFLTSPDGRVYCQNEGPKLVFESLLDSGATYPTLHPKDFKSLGIEQTNYSAQSVETFLTANGLIRMRMYEMFVSVVDDSHNSLVDEADPVWPICGRYLGGLCPVASCIGVSDEVDAQGLETNHRLSGLLPFLACYTTITPTQNIMFLGEDRNDVLGLQRMPGQRRWDISLPSTQRALNRGLFDNPKVTFNHRQGYIVDRDRENERHNADWMFGVGTETEFSLQSHPMLDAAADAFHRRTNEFAATRGAMDPNLFVPL